MLDTLWRLDQYISWRLGRDVYASIMLYKATPDQSQSFQTIRLDTLAMAMASKKKETAEARRVSKCAF